MQEVIDQTYTKQECVIVNVGNPDNTKEAAKKWLQKDHRIKYIRQVDTVVSGVRNSGITPAKGEFILPLYAVVTLKHIMLKNV